MNTNVFNREKMITSIIFKAISLIASVYGLVFTIDSIKSFTFFTTLSNVALDIVLAVFIMNKKEPPAYKLSWDISHCRRKRRQA